MSFFSEIKGFFKYLFRNKFGCIRCRNAFAPCGLCAGCEASILKILTEVQDLNNDELKQYWLTKQTEENAK